MNIPFYWIGEDRELMNRRTSKKIKHKILFEEDFHFKIAKEFSYEFIVSCSTETHSNITFGRTYEALNGVRIKY